MYSAAAASTRGSDMFGEKLPMKPAILVAGIQAVRRIFWL